MTLSPIPRSTRALLGLLTLVATPLLLAQQTNRTTVLRSTHGASISGASGGAFAFGGAGTADAEEMMRRVQQAAAQAMEEASFAMNSGFAGESPSATAAEPPLLVHVRPLPEPARGHWLEDLAVLDRLLQEELAKLEGRSAGQALGVRLRLTGRGAAAPMWVEDHGVLLQGEVRFPLAGSDPQNKPKAGPNPTVSAWERARVEVRNANGTRVVTRSQTSGGGETYDPQRVAALDRAVAAVLGEARHLRELKPGETVTITLGGQDDSLARRRITYQIAQPDLAVLAREPADGEAFRRRIKKQVQ